MRRWGTVEDFLRAPGLRVAAECQHFGSDRWRGPICPAVGAWWGGSAAVQRPAIILSGDDHDFTLAWLRSEGGDLAADRRLEPGLPARRKQFLGRRASLRAHAGDSSSASRNRWYQPGYRGGRGSELCRRAPGKTEESRQHPVPYDARTGTHVGKVVLRCRPAMDVDG